MSSSLERLADKRVELVYDRRTGTFDIVSLKDKRAVVRRASSHVTYRDDRGRRRTVMSTAAALRSVRRGSDGFGEMLEVRHEFDEGPRMLLRFHLGEGATHLLMQSQIDNTTSGDIRLERFDLIDLEWRDGGRLDLNEPYRNWAFMGMCYVAGLTRPVHVQTHELRYGTTTHRGFGITAIRRWEGLESAVFAFVTADDFHGETHVQGRQGVMGGEADFLRVFNEGEGALVEKGQSRASELLFIDVVGPVKRSLESCAKLTARVNDCRVLGRPLTGWATWDYYLGDVTERDVMRNVRFLAEHREQIPVDYIQLDAGYCVDWNWRQWNGKFPHGPKWLADEIRKHGFKPGIWVMPFVAGTELAASHPDWMLKDVDGKPLSVSGRYALDGSHPEACEWVRELGRTIAQDWGYEYVKLDGANSIALNRGCPHDAHLTPAGAYRRGLAAFREGLSDDVVLMGGPLPNSVGLVNAMRLGPDVGARWDWSKYDRRKGLTDNYPGPGTLWHCYAGAINLYFLNNVVWHNDPDYLVVRPRGDRSELSWEEAVTWTSIVSLTGSAIMLSDNMTKLPRKQLSLLSRVLPHHRGTAVPVDYFDEEVPSILRLNLKTRWDKYVVVGLINHTDLSQTYTLEASKLGLSPRKEYHLFDFWNETYLGTFRKSWTSQEIRPRHTQVIGIRQVKSQPQVVGSNIHITQGAVDLADVRYKKDEKTLFIGVNAAGQRTGRVYIYAPPGYKLRLIKGVKKISPRIFCVSAVLSTDRTLQVPFD